MNCVFSVIILSAVCHRSYTYAKKEYFYENPITKNPIEPSNIVESEQETLRRNRHSSSLSSAEPRHTEKLWRFEIDVPEVLDTLKRYTGVSITDARNSKNFRSKDNGFLNQKLRIEVKSPNLALMMGYLNNLINIQAARRFNRVYYGYVEEGPGTIKSENIEYPPRYQEGRLKHLLRLKKRMQGKASP